MQRKAGLGLGLAFVALAMSAQPVAADDANQLAGANSGAGMPAATILQLEAVRQATAKYHDLDAALADGYVDIGVFVPGMGWHYLKPALVDDTFEPTRPELLVYADDDCHGTRRLVAVEYGVPLALVKGPPEGFVGGTDRWDANAITQMWMVHAWVWEWNPVGMFNPTNPRLL